MNCKICGNVLSDDAKFCTECGADTSIEAVAAASEEPVAEESNAVQEAEKTALENVEIETSEKIPAVTAEDEPAAPAEEEKTPVTESIAAPAEESVKTPETEPKTVPAEEKKKSVKVGAGRIFGASVVAIFAIVFITITGLLLSAKIGLNGNVLKNRAEDANIGAILDSDFNSEITAGEYIYNNIGSSILGSKGIKTQDLRMFLIEADFEDFAAEKIEAYADYIIDGKDKDPSASSQDFVEFFSDNEKTAAEVFDEPFSESDYKNMAIRLENRGLDDVLSVKEWGNKLGFKASNLSYIFSYLTLGIVAAISLFMLVWIAIIVDKKARHLTGFYGNIMLLSGLVMFIPSAAFLAGASTVALSTNALGAFLAAELLVPFALVMLCTGAFELILGIIFKRIKKFIKKKAAKA